MRAGLPKPLRRRGCAWRDTCFLLIVKEVRGVRVIEGVKVVKPNVLLEMSKCVPLMFFTPITTLNIYLII